MQAHLATLCERVDVRGDGTLDIVGAAPEVIDVPQLPWKGALRFALVLQVEVVDDPADIRLDIVVVRARDGAVVGRVDAGELAHRRTARHVEGAPPYLPFALELQVELTEPGQHGVVVRNKDGQRMAFVVFVIRAA